MATTEYLSSLDRRGSSNTVCGIGAYLQNILAAFSGKLAIINRVHTSSEPFCAEPNAKGLRHKSGFLGLPTVRHNTNSNYSQSVDEEAKLLNKILHQNVSCVEILYALERCGGISQLLSLDFAELVRIIGSQDQATKLFAIRSIVMSSLSYDVTASPTINNTNTLINYLKADMGKRRVETFRAIFLDCHNRLITDEILWTGSVNAVQVHPREVMRRALEVDAAAIIVAHNHPSQMVQPSIADIAITKVLLKSACALGLTLHDHLIISASSHHSMRIHKSVDPWE